eukprot:CAMPEP_0114562510 /NCGR_PEP_ID=MMETSP0114-20121206/12568_1 /TAXON_ID=31324 /ORGANISM="Goniomonas sp, Strain m" /LENGTH=198 /DNA_ID=CAMNT_0001748201 /DNA_START=37 /DNA_END=630 /DNA_ORIENTATION=+
MTFVETGAPESETGPPRGEETQQSTVEAAREGAGVFVGNESFLMLENETEPEPMVPSTLAVSPTVSEDADKGECLKGSIKNDSGVVTEDRAETESWESASSSSFASDILGPQLSRWLPFMRLAVFITLVFGPFIWAAIRRHHHQNELKRLRRLLLESKSEAGLLRSRLYTARNEISLYRRMRHVAQGSSNVLVLGSAS